MAHKPLVESLVESIKGYFSITGLIILGIYLVKTPEDAPFHWPLLSYLSGTIAILIGGGVGVWYSIHVVHHLLVERRGGEVGRWDFLILLTFISCALLVILSIVLGALTMSCGRLLG
jgi:hypothetical protein